MRKILGGRVHVGTRSVVLQVSYRCIVAARGSNTRVLTSLLSRAVRGAERLPAVRRAQARAGSCWERKDVQAGSARLDQVQQVSLDERSGMAVGATPRN